MYKILVCGSRDFEDVELLQYELGYIIGSQVVMIIHGDAQGADRMAGEYARYMGHAEVRVPSNWEYYGWPAGAVRNTWMLELKPDFVIAFKTKPVSKGTDDMIAKAQRAGIEIKVINAYNIEKE